jgi:hypothetical protein
MDEWIEIVDNSLVKAVELNALPLLRRGVSGNTLQQPNSTVNSPRNLYVEYPANLS